jgi:hypothetical protein
VVHCSASSRCRSGRPSADCIEIGNHFRRNLKTRRLKVLAKMREGRCSGDQQDIGRALQKPRKRNLHGCSPERGCGCVKADDCNGVKPPSGKNGTYAIPWADRS